MTLEYDLVNCVCNEKGIVVNKRPKLVTPEVPLGEYLFDKLDDDPSRTVFIDNPSGRKWTCARAKEEANKVARGIIACGLGPNDKICFYAPNSDYHAICQLAVYASAAVYVGCIWTNTKRELAQIVLDSESSFLVCCKANFSVASAVADEFELVKCLIQIDGSAPPSTATGKKIATLNDLRNCGLVRSDVPIPVPLPRSPRDMPVAILFSSGSTGKPKGVIKTHFNQVAHCHNLPVTQIYGPPGGRVTCHQPLPHLSGFECVQCAIVGGLTIVFNNGYEVESFLQSVQKYRITYAFLAPSFMVLLLKSGQMGQIDTSSLKTVVTGGACLPDTIKKKFFEAANLESLRQFYGSTEAGMVTFTVPDVLNWDTIGLPVPGAEFKVTNPETGEALGPNQVGELYIRGWDAITPGYFNLPDATVDAFSGDGFFKSGDAVYYEDDGYFYIVDRYKEVIKVSTQQVAPAELESILLSHPLVSEAAVLGIPDEVLGQVPMAYVVMNDSVERADSFKEELIELVDSQVNDYKKLRGGIQFLASSDLPKISLGKIDRAALRRMCGLRNF